MLEENCLVCRFFRIDPKNMKMGFCRYEPPQLLVVPQNNGMQVNGVFPPTQLDSWCGKWEEKK